MADKERIDKLKLKEVEYRSNTLKYIRKIFNDDFKDYSEREIQLLIEKNYWIFGEEYNLMVGSEEDDFNKLREVYCNKVLKIKNNDKSKLSEREVDLFICANTENRFDRRKHLIVEIKKPKHYLKKEDYRQIEDYKDEISKIPQFKSEEKNSWNYVLLYRVISKDHDNFFNDKIKNKFTGETVDSNYFFKIYVVRWEDLLIDCEHRMGYLKDKLDNKKRNMLKLKKGRRYTIEHKTRNYKYLGCDDYLIEIAHHRYIDMQCTKKINTVAGWLYKGTFDYIFIGTLNEQNNKIIEVVGFSSIPFKLEEFRSEYNKLNNGWAKSQFKNGVFQLTLNKKVTKEFIKNNALKYWYWRDE